MFLCLILGIAFCFCPTSCSDGGAVTAGNVRNTAETVAANYGDLPELTGDNAAESVVITVKDYGSIVVRLYPGRAPVTVENFKKLVRAGYYDGTTFHRVIKNFMIQGGAGAQTGTIKGEFSANGVENTLKHERGVISMARGNAYDSASSQFFICQTTERCRHLDGQYAAFGRVLYGMETVDRIAAVETDAVDRPTTPVVIESVRFYNDAVKN